MKFLNQLECSTLLFDTIYGLILFYSFDSLLTIYNGYTLVFYLFSMFILVHWWLIFKSTDDSFDEEVTDSAADIVFGIVYAIVLYYLVQYSRASGIRTATMYLIGIFALDILWAVIWRYIGTWKTANREKIKRMEKELEKSILLDIELGLSFCLLFIVRYSLFELVFITCYIGLYLLFIGLTCKLKTLKMDIF